MSDTIEILCKKNTNFLLIDTSYYVFYRYFATLRWYKFQATTPKELDYEKYMKMNNLLMHLKNI